MNMEQQTINFLGCSCPKDPKEHDAFYLPSLEMIFIFHEGQWIPLDKLYPKDS